MLHRFGRGVAVPVAQGYYSFPVGGVKATSQSPAVPGQYCAGGVQLPCPAGYYGTNPQETSPTCTAQCDAGYWCPAGSTHGQVHVCGNNTVYCPTGSSHASPVAPGYYTSGGDSTGATRTQQLQCTAGSFCLAGVRISCPFGTYGSVPGLQTASCSGRCGAGFVCPAGSLSGTSMQCPIGYYCSGGLVTACPAGTYNAHPQAFSVSNCSACPANTYSNATNAASVGTCNPCARYENSTAGSIVCWPGIVSALASNPPPVVPSLSPGDVLTITFSKPTNVPPLSTFYDADIQAMFVFSSFIGVNLVGVWNRDASAVAITVGATSLGNTTASPELTAVGVLTMTLNATSNLQDAAKLSHAAVYPWIRVSGTWGVATIPKFLPSTGLYSPSFVANTGGQAGIGAGDTLVLRFDNPCKQLPVTTKANLDALFNFSAPLGLDYTGAWVTSGWFKQSSVLITITQGLPAGTNAAGAAVGVLGVAVRPSAGLTSLDSTTAASNTSTLIAYGTWGDAPTATVIMRSFRSLRVTALPPSSRVRWSVSQYHVQWSNSGAFTTLLGEADAPVTSGTETAVYTIVNLTTETPVYVRVAARVTIKYGAEDIALPPGAIGPTTLSLCSHPGVANPSWRRDAGRRTNVDDWAADSDHHGVEPGSFRAELCHDRGIVYEQSVFSHRNRLHRGC